MTADTRDDILQEIAFGFCGEQARKTKYGLRGNALLLTVDDHDNHYADDITQAMSAMAQENFADFKGYRLHNIVFDAAHPISDPNLHAPQLFLQAAPELCEAIKDISEDDLVRDIAFVKGLPEQNRLHPGPLEYPSINPVTGQPEMVAIPPEHYRGKIYDTMNIHRERIVWEKPVLWVFAMTENDVTEFMRQAPDTAHWLQKIHLPNA